MSIALMTAVWPLALAATDKLVLLALADRADDDGRCWPGVASLAAKTSLSDRSVQRAIQSLVEGGHLSRFEKPGVGCTYHIHPRHSVTPDNQSPVTKTTPTPDTVSPNTSGYINPSDSRARGRAASVGSYLPDDWEPDELTGISAESVARWRPGELERELSKFRDHWKSAAGAGARKRDWQAAWRKWIANHEERRAPDDTGGVGRRSGAERMGRDIGQKRPNAGGSSARSGGRSDAGEPSAMVATLLARRAARQAGHG